MTSRRSRRMLLSRLASVLMLLRKSSLQTYMTETTRVRNKDQQHRKTRTREKTKNREKRKRTHEYARSKSAWILVGLQARVGARAASSKTSSQRCRHARCCRRRRCARTRVLCVSKYSAAADATARQHLLAPRWASKCCCLRSSTSRASSVRAHHHENATSPSTTMARHRRCHCQRRSLPLQTKSLLFRTSKLRSAALHRLL